MTVTVDDNVAQHRFEIHRDGELAGYAVYEQDAGTRSFVHTVIEPRFEGHGLGSVLARGALDATREAGLAVLPICPFIHR